MTALVPEWELSDRLHKSLRLADCTAGEMAGHLGVHRTTIYRWLDGDGEPRVGMLRAWAERTGVDFDWLARPKGFEPPTSWLVAAA